MDKSVIKYLPKEVQECFILSGLVDSKEGKKDNGDMVLQLSTKIVGIIPESLNFNGFVDRWNVDYDIENKLVLWQIKIINNNNVYI